MDGMNRASYCSMTRIYCKGHWLMEHIYGLYIKPMLHVLSNLNSIVSHVHGIGGFCTEARSGRVVCILYYKLWF